MNENLEHMMAAANAVINTISVHAAIECSEDEDVVFVDIRNDDERADSGQIPGAVAAPRGLLEFYVDAASALHDPVFVAGNRIILYSASGGRSTLAAKTLYDMGVAKVAHIAGGFDAWQEAGGPVAFVD